MTLDLLFPVLGETLPTDHGYLLYAAASHLAPALHDPQAGIRAAAITGLYTGNGLLSLNQFSRWRIRLPDDRIRDVLPLAGKLLCAGDHSIRLGAPTIATLMPAPSLYARIVTFKSSQPRPRGGPIDDPNRFLEVVRRKLAEINVKGEPSLPPITQGPRAGELRRRVVRVKGKRFVGFSLLVEGLTAEESIVLQEKGLGGRGRMGCGFFGPMKGRN